MRPSSHRPSAPADVAQTGANCTQYSVHAVRLQHSVTFSPFRSITFYFHFLRRNVSAGVSLPSYGGHSCGGCEACASSGAQGALGLPSGALQRVAVRPDSDVRTPLRRGEVALAAPALIGQSKQASREGPRRAGRGDVLLPWPAPLCGRNARNARVDGARDYAGRRGGAARGAAGAVHCALGPRGLAAFAHGAVAKRLVWPCAVRGPPRARAEWTARRKGRGTARRETECTLAHAGQAGHAGPRRKLREAPTSRRRAPCWRQGWRAVTAAAFRQAHVVAKYFSRPVCCCLKGLFRCGRCAGVCFCCDAASAGPL